MSKALEENNLSPVDKIWDWNSRAVLEDGYSIEELNWILGEQVMLKSDFDQSIKEFSDKLYEHIKHGDEEHMTWLKDEMNKFISNG